jgi:predicted permease
MAERVRGLPGIESVSLTLGLPVQMGVSYGAVAIEGQPAGNTKDITMFNANWVEPEYFAQIGLPFIEGRVFDRRSGVNEIVINQSMATRLWPGVSAVGRRVRFGEGNWMTVVGVVRDVRLPGVTSSASQLQVHMPFSGVLGEGTLLVRVGPGAGNLVAGVTAAIQTVDSRWGVGRVETMDASVARLLTAPRFSMTLLGVFACIAAVLAIVGLYGVIAYTVSQRTREMGIRIALGATTRNVRSLVMTYGARLSVAGIMLGIGTAFAATRLLRAQLYEVNPLDPVTFAAVAVLLIGVALMATYAPARRATRVDPIVAVRAE